MTPGFRFASRLGSAALLSLLLLPADRALTADHALWLRYPALSPDGKTIAFEYRGNLWKVSADGGVATPLTVGESYNSMPVWSPDGSRIAFASDRNGNLDVYVMPAEGGRANRLTYHSADETPSSFTPDGKSVLFSAAILDSPVNAEFPTGARPELYRVDLAGKRLAHGGVVFTGRIAVHVSQRTRHNLSVSLSL